MKRRRYYAVVARVSGLGKGGWHGGVDIPTFFLDADIQGITSVKHAKRVARKVIDPLDLLTILDITVTPPEDL